MDTKTSFYSLSPITAEGRSKVSTHEAIHIHFQFILITPSHNPPKNAEKKKLDFSLFHSIIAHRTRRNPPLIKFLLQPRNLRQRLCIPDHLLDFLFLFIGELYAVLLIGFAGRSATGEGAADIEGAGFDAHYLRRGD